MLSGYQVEVVGFHTDEGPICWDCARERLGSLTVERARMGLSTGMGEHFAPLSRYEAHEASGEAGYHCGCVDEAEDIPKASEAPEGYEGPVDDGYWSNNGVDEPVWRESIYHEACARYDCTECGEDLAS
jgi:hypothetical protein